MKNITTLIHEVNEKLTDCEMPFTQDNVIWCFCRFEASSLSCASLKDIARMLMDGYEKPTLESIEAEFTNRYYSEDEDGNTNQSIIDVAEFIVENLY